MYYLSLIPGERIEDKCNNVSMTANDCTGLQMSRYLNIPVTGFSSFL